MVAISRTAALELTFVFRHTDLVAACSRTSELPCTFQLAADRRISLISVPPWGIRTADKYMVSFLYQLESLSKRHIDLLSCFSAIHYKKVKVAHSLLDYRAQGTELIPVLGSQPAVT